MILKKHYAFKNQTLSLAHKDGGILSSDLPVACSSADFQRGPSYMKRGEKCASIPYTKAVRS
jgi:hypothetical protein